MSVVDPMSLSLEGRVAVVTGAGRGIGRATAELFAARGASVVVNDLGTERERTTFDPSVADEVVHEIVRRGGRAVASHASVAEAEAARSIISTAVEAFGRVDILANVAGNKRSAPFLEMTEQQWDEAVAVHLKGTFLCTQAACREMAKAGYGRVVNISSHSALGVSSRGFSGGSTNYAAAKAGVLGLTRSLAREIASLGITANAVFPSAETRNQAASRDQRRVAGIVETAASRETPGRPEDVAQLIAFLATPFAGSITGRTFLAKGERIELFSDPTAIRTVIRAGGWTVEAIAARMPGLLEGTALLPSVDQTASRRGGPTRETATS